MNDRWAVLRRMNMRQLARRIGHVVIVLWVLSIGTFLMLELLPGSLADALIGENARPEDIQLIEEELGLNKPLSERYLTWLGRAVRGDLGRSPLRGEDVAGSIGNRLPVSVSLMIYTQILALLIALPLGVAAGYREGKIFDKVVSSLSFGVLAVPHFVLGLLLILAFAIGLRWFPATGYIPVTEGVLRSIHSLTLPALTLALVEAPVYLRLLRSDIAETLREPWITVARAKGLSDRYILFRHALRPSSFSLITIVGINMGHLIGGAVIIESLFALPGVGRLLIEAITQRDYVMLQGVVLFIGAAFVLLNLLVDIAYTLLDPRVAHHEK